jgi:dethiobiotin synthetase
MAPFTTADLLGEITFTATTDVGLVETVGGVRSPMTADGDSATFAAALSPDATILVADGSLGTINAVRLSTAALTATTAVTVMLNRYDPHDDLHRRNRAWLTDRDGYTVATTVAELAASLIDQSDRRR